jgi:uncharacterized membrane protein (DUF4010 family)
VSRKQGSSDTVFGLADIAAIARSIAELSQSGGNLERNVAAVVSLAANAVFNKRRGTIHKTVYVND